VSTPPSNPADRLSQLRGWQKDAYHEYFRLPRRDFLLVATPGAGKTAYALTVAAELLARREVAALTVVTPTEHLKHQWAQAAAGFGIAIDSGYRNAQGRADVGFNGVAVTYAQVAAHPALHRQRTERRRTLVVFDEIHHAGDALSWGDAVKEAFDPARRRLALTGTPFRSDANPTPDQLGEPAFQPLNASVHFDRVLYDGGEFGTAAAAGSPEEEDFLGLPGLLDPDQVRTLLSKRQQSQLAARSRAAKSAPPAQASPSAKSGPRRPGRPRGAPAACPGRAPASRPAASPPPAQPHPCPRHLLGAGGPRTPRLPEPSRARRRRR
jgi:Type III restriction enzyme, res subunit